MKVDLCPRTHRFTCFHTVTIKGKYCRLASDAETRTGALSGMFTLIEEAHKRRGGIDVSRPVPPVESNFLLEALGV